MSGLGDVIHGTIFGQNGDSAFTLQRVGIHDAGGVLGGPDPSLGQNRIHQGGLAMIDVCDDGHITEGRSMNPPILPRTRGRLRIRIPHP